MKSYKTEADRLQEIEKAAFEAGWKAGHTFVRNSETEEKEVEQAYDRWQQKRRK